MANQEIRMTKLQFRNRPDSPVSELTQELHNSSAYSLVRLDRQDSSMYRAGLPVLFLTSSEPGHCLSTVLSFGFRHSSFLRPSSFGIFHFRSASRALAVRSKFLHAPI